MHRALNEGLFGIIKQSMLGSVIGNMLLVLGSALIARSFYKPPGEEEGNSQVTYTFVPKGQSKNFLHGLGLYASLLLLAAFGLVVPTVFAQLHIEPDKVPDAAHTTHHPANQTVLSLSHGVSLIMCSAYALFVYFQFKHSHIFSEEDSDEEATLWPSFAIAGLGCITVLIAFMSEFLVDAIEPAARAMGMSQAFIAVILLPIFGNACEHSTAIVAAYHGKMDVSIGIAIGSSIQIAGFVVPFLVLVSWAWQGTRDNLDGSAGALDLNFHPLSVIFMIVSIVIVNTIVYNAGSNWLEGAALIFTYTIISVAFWYTPEHTDA